VERFDTIVVGAGPAGSVTAHRLATAGLSVLLLDRARFPRDKPCGGGLTLRAVRQLPINPAPVVEDEVSTFELGLDYGTHIERHGRGPLILMTQRRRLDHFLAEQAAEVGADFRDGMRVTTVETDDNGATVSCGGARAWAPVVIGADGANGVTARSLGLARKHTYGVALEGNVHFPDVEEARYRGRAIVELGSVPGGYTWIFPKGDHANVGAGGWGHAGPQLRGHLSRLCREYGVPEERVRNLRGHRLPMRGAGESPVAGRGLLVGDAAGLVDPLSGDGMFEAFVSARLAAEAVLDLLAGRTRDLGLYGVRIDRELRRLTSACWGAKVAFDRFPRLTFAATRMPLVWDACERLLCGDVSHPGATRGLARAPLRFVDGLARASGDPGRAFRAAA
jgi:geranylgeranyl reductase family protein